MAQPDSILILHMSDLHFGASGRFAKHDHAELGRVCAEDVEVAKDQLRIKIPVAIVVTTGDIAQMSLPCEYQQALAFFKGLSSGLDVVPRRFVFCPGNHDISWPRCEQVQKDQEIYGFDEQELRQKMDALKFEFFTKFLRDFYKTKNLDAIAAPLEKEASLYRFEEFHLSVIALNSCERESHRKDDHLGKVSETQAKAVIKEWQDPKLHYWLKVLIVHHNPDLTVVETINAIRDALKGRKDLDEATVERYLADLAGFEGNEYLQNVVHNANVQLVLHGHQHATNGKLWNWKSNGMAHVLSAGSLGAPTKDRPQDHPNSLRLILLDLINSKLKSYVLDYNPLALRTNSVENGAFVLGSGQGNSYEHHLSLPPNLPPRSRPRSPTSSTPSPVNDKELRRYQNWAQERFRYIDLFRVGAGSLSIKLEDIYVPLRISPREPKLDVGGCRHPGCVDEALNHVTEAKGEVELENSFSLAGPDKDIVIFGEPGAGKTTCLHKLLHQVFADGTESLGLAEGTVPVFLRLRHLDRQLLDKSPAAFIQSELLQTAQDEFKSDFAQRLWDRGNLLLLFDGLDEIADNTLRADVARYLRQRMRGVHSRGIRAAVSSRYAGYGGKVQLGGGFLSLDVRPLYPELVRKLIRVWFREARRAQNLDTKSYGKSDKQAATEADKLIARLESSEYASQQVKVLVSTPLLLTLLCVVFMQGHQIPQRRTEFYRECLRVLLSRYSQEERDIRPLLMVEDALALLRPLAHRLHCEQRRDDLQFNEIASWVKPALTSLRRLQRIDVSAEQLHQWLHQTAGVLTEYAHDRYGFMHLGLQEYLCAMHIAREGGIHLVDLAQQFGNDWWKEVILLLLGQPEHKVFVPLMHHVVTTPALLEEQKLLRQCLEEAQEPTPEPFLKVLRNKEEEPARQAAVLRLFVDRDEPAIGELAAGLQAHPDTDVSALAQRICELHNLPVITVELPDSDDRVRDLVRKDVRDFLEPTTGMRFLWVPGDRFEMGAEDIWEACEPIHWVQISSFWLAETQVTNTQYAKFLKAVPGQMEPAYWRDRRFSAMEQPVVGVSWHEAVAFCKWLAKQTGQTFQLPSEAQWEFTAKGTDGRKYPWGNEKPDETRACFDLGEKGQPAPVGSFPAGKGPFGHHDLAGNVWEWCADVWDAKAYKKRARRELLDPVVTEGNADRRALRGGCFWLDARVLRATNRLSYRLRGRAEDRYESGGFRVALAPPSP